jgi:hypothetical protein
MHNALQSFQEFPISIGPFTCLALSSSRKFSNYVFLGVKKIQNTSMYCHIKHNFKFLSILIPHNQQYMDPHVFWK